MTSHGVSTLHIITRVFRKIPVPMTLPTTMETDAARPRPRTSVKGWRVCSVMRARVLSGRLPDLVRQQVFVRVAAADEFGASAFFDEGDGGQGATVVGEHLGDGVSARDEEREQLAGPHVRRELAVVGEPAFALDVEVNVAGVDRKSTRLNSSHVSES